MSKRTKKMDELAYWKSRAETLEADLLAERKYVENEHIASWARVMDALLDGNQWLTEESNNKSLCDQTVDAIKERNRLRKRISTKKKKVKQ